MGTSVIPSPEIQAARSVVSQNCTKMDNRSKSAANLKVAFDHFQLNVENDYFGRNSVSIKTLVEKTNNLTKAIGVLDQNNIDPGTCKMTRTVPGRLFGTRQVVKEVSIRDANNEIRTVVEDPVVVTGLRTLGIIPQPKAPLFTMPERPSAKTVAKATGFTAAAATIGTGVYYDTDKLYVKTAAEFIGGKMMAGVQFVQSKLPAMPEMPAMPSMKDIKIPSMAEAKQFVGEHQVAVGVGAAAIVAVGAGIAIYKHRKNKQAQAAAAQNAVPAPVATDDQKKI